MQREKKGSHTICNEQKQPIKSNETRKRPKLFYMHKTNCGMYCKLQFSILVHAMDDPTYQGRIEIER